MASRACLRWVAPPTATRRERRRCDQRSRRVARRAAAATADAADDAAAARDDGDDGGRHDFTTVFGRGRVASRLATYRASVLPHYLLLYFDALLSKVGGRGDAPTVLGRMLAWLHNCGDAWLFAEPEGRREPPQL